MKNHSKIAVIFWGHNSPATEHFAQRLSAPFYKIDYLRHKRGLQALIKYIPMWIKTFAILLKQRPSVVHVVNTPVFAPLCVYVYCLFSGAKYIMDVHGHSLFVRKWAWARPLQRILARRALVNIVKLPKDKAFFEAWGARVLQLERPPIGVSNHKVRSEKDADIFTVTSISTFNGDEPLDLIIEAAKQIPDMRFSILGDTKLASQTFLESAPSNVVFPGYLTGDAYWGQLLSSQAIITLTTSPDSMSSGAIETMALKKPPILSKQPALTDYFTKGTIFVEHSVESIVEGLHTFRKEEDRLTQEIIELATEKRQKWETTFEQLLAMIGEDPCK